MSRWLAVLAVFAGLLAIPAGAAANPFQPGTTREASSRPASGPPGGFTATIAGMQRDMNAAISAKFREMESGGSPAVLFGLMLLSFAYGALHAAGPGHGKSVVASYLIARPRAWPAGIAIGTLSSLLQGAVSVLLVIVLALVFQVGGLDLMAHATVIEAVSYGLIVLIGLWLLYGAVTGRGCHAHAHGHDHACGAHDHDGIKDRTTLGLILAAGITPCASAIIVLLFALAQDALALGIGAALVMSLGMGVTVSAVALLSIFGRKAIAIATGHGRTAVLIERGLSLAGALLVIGFAGVLMLGAWTRL
jgi:ABC-type nickel/cobalt efflux system permease component RcnA